MKAELKKEGPAKVGTHLVYGFPIKEIIKKANGGQVSLVVMGSQGKGYISEIFLGSASHAVARHADVPVLLIPALR